MADSTSSDMHKALFMELVIMLSSSAMQYLGKIINPMTSKTELNLEAAQATIDMIEMIEAKTRGNLDRDEDRLLKNTLTSLRMNYVETAAAAPAKTEPPAATTPEPAPDATKDEKEPKFHKSYT
jgi:hypothetical protein